MNQFVPVLHGEIVPGDGRIGVPAPIAGRPLTRTPLSQANALNAASTRWRGSGYDETVLCTTERYDRMKERQREPLGLAGCGKRCQHFYAAAKVNQT